MNWYAREELAESRRNELEQQVDRRRRTCGPRRPVHFWLLATLRTWLVSATR